MTPIAVRAERTSDHAAVHDIHRQAFCGEGEAALVAALRRAGDAAVSLVAERRGRLAGHILFSRLRAPMRALALAPLAVRPEDQGQGVGSTLVRAGLDRALRERWEAVFVLGAPPFYRRFGFDAEAARGYSCRYGGESFMVSLLGTEPVPRKGALDYPAAFSSLD